MNIDPTGAPETDKISSSTEGRDTSHAHSQAVADAYLEWAALAEPGDQAAGWLVNRLGALAARQWLDLVVADPVSATLELAAHASPQVIDHVVQASERWSRRVPQSRAAKLRERAHLCGARPVVPHDSEWPAGLEALGDAAPMALWVRGRGRLNDLFDRSVALVGARASTSYGEHMATSMAGDLSEAGWTVVSGGAYGIDAAAHRGALVAGAPTVAVMAGGVDRLYPAGNQDLLEKIIASGVVVSEAPPGWAPHRHRFLQRNRLIACANATVVVEAAYRSGALNTATHAQELARPVGAVPGPATSASSAGCHRLLRDGAAVLVTSAREVVELAGPMQLHQDEAMSEAGQGRLDFDTPQDRAVFDALGTRLRDLEDVARIAGLTRAEARAALGRMELSGIAQMEVGRWRRLVSN